MKVLKSVRKPIGGWLACLACLVLWMGLGASHAQVVTEGSVRYRLGALAFEETAEAVQVQRQGRRIATSRILPGGSISPALYVSNDGRLHWGATEFDIRSVEVDGVDLRQIDPVDYRAKVGFVTQEPRLFAGTLRDNVLLGRIIWRSCMRRRPPAPGRR